MIPQNELFNNISISGRIICINISICNTAWIHKTEEVQSEFFTVHLSDSKYVCNFASRYRSTTISTKDIMFCFPFSQIGLQQHKVNGFSFFVYINLISYDWIDFFRLIPLTDIWMYLICLIDFLFISLEWMIVYFRILCIPIQLKCFNTICHSVCIHNGFHPHFFRQ